MKTSRHPRRHLQGFMLLEVVLAIGVFAIAVTGFVVALQKTSDLGFQTRREMRLTRLLESALAKAMSQPVLEEGTSSEPVEEMANEGMQMETTVEPMTEIENEDGQILQEMYRIKVRASWFEGASPQEMTAETWRYSRLYQP